MPGVAIPRSAGNLVPKSDVFAHSKFICRLVDVFANGRSEWELKYIPGNTSFQLSLDDQPFTASYTQDTDACNSFLLKFSGTYTTEVDSIHQFSWEGELSYFGTKLGGTFSYTDDWTQTIQQDDGSGGHGGRHLDELLAQHLIERCF